MSAKPKPRASEPARPIASTGKPPTSRKASEPSAPKFYNGPTVSAGADVKNAATQAANNGVVGAKRQTSKAAAAVKRHPYSLISLIGTLPLLLVASLFSNVAFTKSRDTYKSVKEHRFTEAAGVYASRGYQQAQRSYVWVKPRAIGAAARAERFTREHVSPRAIQTMSWVADQTSKGYAIARVHVARLYRIYVHPHVGPYVTKASVATAPYVAAYNRRLHEPYIRPTIQRYFPELVAEKPKSFFQFIADKLPALAALNIAESKGSVDSFVDAPAKEKTKVLANSASTLSKSASSVASSASAKIAATSFSVPNKRAELAAAREAIESQVNAQGRRGYDAIEKELVSVHREFSNDQLPKFVNHGRASLEREIDHVLAGLEKLYTGSKTLTRDQVKQSSEMTETKVAKLLHQARDTVESKRAALQNRAQPIVQRAKADVRNTLGTSFRALADRMKLAESTPKEWDQYNAVRDDVVAWEQKYDGLLDASTSSQIAALNKDIDNQVTEAHSDFGEIFDGFRARLGILKRAAFDHIEALEASSTPSPSSPSSSSADNGRYSILPIVEAGAALEAAHAIIGKGKAEIVQALGQADTAKSSSGLSASASSLSSQLSASAQFAYDAASSAVHDATRSAMYDVGATPSPEIFEEYAASIANAAKDTASVALTAASSAIHDATRSALSAVGATPSPESIVEYASSLNRVAKSSASVAVDAAASVAHDATRAAVKAIGVSSAPEGVRESAASVIAAASSVVHDASRSAASAVGIVPSPESVQEHAESLSSVVSSSVASAVSVAKTPGEYIESAAHVIKDALPTDQAAALAASFQSLVGLLPAETPLASSASSYASALASSGSAARSDLLASGSSLLSSLNVAASASVHSATRAASRALGATPSPESVGEYLEDAKVKMMEARRHAESLVRKHASTLLPETPMRQVS
ncbi:hypothetical protein Q5752_003164 [Cryptotrichosporon argae]